jgi:hypothetical protein
MHVTHIFADGEPASPSLIALVAPQLTTAVLPLPAQTDGACTMNNDQSEVEILQSSPPDDNRDRFPSNSADEGAVQAATAAISVRVLIFRNGRPSSSFAHMPCLFSMNHFLGPPYASQRLLKTKLRPT